jgi:hypothetical protein
MRTTEDTPELFHSASRYPRLSEGLSRNARQSHPRDDTSEDRGTNVLVDRVTSLAHVAVLGYN